MEQMNITAPAPKKSKKPLIIAIVAVAAVAVIATVAIVLFNTVFNKLDVMPYITVETVGKYEGYGSALVSLDYVALAEELEFEEIKDIKEFRKLEKDSLVSFDYFIDSKDNKKEIEKEYDLELDELYDLGKAIKITIRNNDGTLSNGDVVKIKVKTDEDAELKKKLVGGELEYTIEGLTELKTVTFEPVYEFSGLNGEGEIKADAEVLDEDLHFWYDDVYFDYSRNYDLSNGDVITVTATVSDYEYNKSQAQAMGYLLPETFTSEVTVSGLGVMVGADITAETVKKIADYAALNSYTVLGENYTVRMAYHLNMGEYGNAVFVALSTPQAIGGETTAVLAVRDCAVNEAGDVVYSYNVGHAGGGYSQTDEVILGYIKNYYGEAEGYVYTALPLPAAEDPATEGETPAEGDPATGDNTGSEDLTTAE